MEDLKINSLWRFIRGNYYIILLLWVIIYFGLKFAAKKWKLPRVWNTYLVLSGLIYGFVFLYVTLLGRYRHPHIQYELSLFWEYRLAFAIQNYRLAVLDMWWVFQILSNVLLFVPIGIFYGEIQTFRKQKPHWLKAFVLGLTISAFVEIIQLISRFGLFETSDIMNNALGMMLGYGIWKVGDLFYRRSCSSSIM